MANFLNSRFDFLSIEPGRGETYNQADRNPGGVILYGHGTWPDSSVLAGRPSRSYIEAFEEHDDVALNRKEAREFAEKHFPNVDVRDYEGSSHIPHRELLAGLPDDDYGWGDDGW